jgi:predicted transcriptional regulator
MMSTTPKARGAPNHSPPAPAGPLGELKVVTVKLPPATHEKLRKAAFELSSTLGAISRAAIEEYLRLYGERQAAQRREERAARAARKKPTPSTIKEPA